MVPRRLDHQWRLTRPDGAVGHGAIHGAWRELRDARDGQSLWMGERGAGDRHVAHRGHRVQHGGRDRRSLDLYRRGNARDVEPRESRLTSVIVAFTNPI